MKTEILALLLVGVLCAGPASGGMSDDASGSSATSLATWNIKISALDSSTTGTTLGKCTGGAGLADYCPVGPCRCFTSTGTASGSAGNGKVTFYETYDEGTSFTEGAVTCVTSYVDIEIAGSKDNESIACNVGDCYAAPYGTNAFTTPEYVNGSCELKPSSSKLFTNAFGGGVGAYGALANGNYPLKYSIKGKAEKIPH